MKWIITPLARNRFTGAPRRVCSRGTPEKLKYFEVCHTCEYSVNLFTVPATLTFTFLSYPILRVSYPIVRLSYPIVRVSYQVFRLSYRENRLSGFPFIVYQVLRLSGFAFIM